MRWSWDAIHYSRSDPKGFYNLLFNSCRDLAVDTILAELAGEWFVDLTDVLPGGLYFQLIVEHYTDG